MLPQSLSVGMLLPNEQVKETSQMVLLSTFLNLVLAMILIKTFSVMGMLYALLIVKCFLILTFGFLCKNKQSDHHDNNFNAYL